MFIGNPSFFNRLLFYCHAWCRESSIEHAAFSLCLLSVSFASQQGQFKQLVLFSRPNFRQPKLRCLIILKGKRKGKYKERKRSGRCCVLVEGEDDEWWWRMIMMFFFCFFLGCFSSTHDDQNCQDRARSWSTSTIQLLGIVSFALAVLMIPAS